MGLVGQYHPFEFASWCTPDWVVISGGDAEQSQGAINQFHAAGANVLHTDDSGAVQVVIDGDGVSVYTWREGGWRREE